MPGQASAQSCGADACLWSGDNYSGSAWALSHSASSENYCTELPGQVQSVFNNSQVQLMLSEGTCGSPGAYKYVSPGEAVPSLGFAATVLSWCPSC
ncbi:peptidase inhibitor family I36 protein [Nocardia sp. NPDC051321]|uniref:peptidase inhibitor family I36 protein n=1 Tax=Nocardia sp. NPDC051321 TaxID=3364323 RepID=UPI0037AB1E34